MKLVTTAKPVRIQLSRRKDWRMPPNTVKVARPSNWGNPWIVGVDGAAAHCVAEYRRLLIGRPVKAWPKDKKQGERAVRFADAALAKDLLRGKNLACWCQLGAPCHVDVLLELANK